jgi:hypothetical protein
VWPLVLIFLVGCEQYVITGDASEELKRTIGAKDHSLVLITDINLVDQVWGPERPSPPKSPLRLHDIKYAGVDTPTKLAKLRSELAAAGATAIVVSLLDEVAWLLNLVSFILLVPPLAPSLQKMKSMKKKNKTSKSSISNLNFLSCV